MTVAKEDEKKAEGFGVAEVTEMDDWMQDFEGQCAADFEQQVRAEVVPGYSKTTQFAFLDVTPFCRDAMAAIVQDTFTQCFASQKPTPWDFSFYLAPISYASWIVRHLVIFPIRLVIIMVGLWLFAVMIAYAYCCSKERAQKVKLAAIKVMANAFLFSWCAVVIEEGTPPARRPGQIYVANHSTVIDVVLLLKKQPLSLTGQEQGGLIGFFQKRVLDVMENMWFDRLAGKDRQYVAKRIEEHVADLTKPPLLVFPEGTCVNNEHVVMFKRGAFQLGESIVPVAIKYNKIFVDGYWNSKEESFQYYLYRLMTAWALVVEVKYLDPQMKRKGESVRCSCWATEVCTRLDRTIVCLKPAFECGVILRCSERVHG
jgi:glycerol-3-phosphate O-acyltransferase 3/4